MNLEQAFQLEQQLIDDTSLLGETTSLAGLINLFQNQIQILEQLKCEYGFSGQHFVNTHKVSKAFAKEIQRITNVSKL